MAIISSAVGFPLIATIQDDPERVRKVYLKVMNLTASVNAPAYFAIAAFAPEIVSVLLGNGWSSAAPMLRVLALWGLLRSFANPVGSLLPGPSGCGRLQGLNAVPGRSVDRRSDCGIRVSCRSLSKSETAHHLSPREAVPLSQS